ncbi:amidase [Polaromonas glacialis]|uniref:amidase n=1 Tax=Polaromonas glacialis TaxID=866564 RepID=UPI00049722CB|nr:amidase [Polaromonas glacialis]
MDAVQTGVRPDHALQAAALPLPEYEQFDATALAGHLRSGQLTPLELLEAAIARLDARRHINAVAMRHDELAYEAAQRLSALGEAERTRLSEQAPLLGVPFALKDLGVAMKGTVTTQGCAFFKDAVADHDSTLVQRYRAAGLNIFAKTTTPEFGQTATTESRLFGLTRNPWNLNYSAGGSSGGAAVAVAAGILPVAHASDGGGSIRIPASNCGLFGLKPSRGLVPMGPKMLEGWLGLSVQHVISRSVRDSAWLLQLTQGPEAGSRTGPQAGDVMDAIARPPRRLRIALMEQNPFGAPVHPDCLDAVRAAARLCESLGHRVEVAAPQLAVGEMFASMGVATATGMLTTVKAREKELGREAREDEFERLNWRSVQLARGYSAEQALTARLVFDQASRTLDLFLGDYDMILSPVTAAPAPLLGAMSLDQPYEDYVKVAMTASPFTAMFNMSGHPAMSVPLHWNDQGMPIGAQFAAPFGDEATLLALAAQLEQAAPWKDRRPAL